MARYYADLNNGANAGRINGWATLGSNYDLNYMRYFLFNLGMEF